MIALSHLLLAGIMIGAGCEAPIGDWTQWAAGGVALLNLGLFVRSLAGDAWIVDVSPYDSID